MGITSIQFYQLCILSHSLEETRIITNPIDVVVERSNTAQFIVTAAGYGNFTYQWYHNNTILSSKTDSNLYIYNSVEQNSGLYHCRVCNQDNNCATSTQAELTLSCKYVRMHFNFCSYEHYTVHIIMLLF